MQIQFKTNKLRKQYENAKEAEKAYEKKVARKYIERINIIQQAQNIDELKAISTLRCHALKGNRKGQWAINLTEFYRLIFTLKGGTMEIVRIDEISKHYEGK